MNQNEVDRLRKFYETTNSVSQGAVRDMIDLAMFKSENSAYQKLGFTGVDDFIGQSSETKVLPESVWQAIAEAPVEKVEDLAVHQIMDAYELDRGMVGGGFFRDLAQSASAKLKISVSEEEIKEHVQEIAREIDPHYDDMDLKPKSIDDKLTLDKYLDSIVELIPILDKAKVSESVQLFIKMRENELFGLRGGERGKA